MVSVDDDVVVAAAVEDGDVRDGADDVRRLVGEEWSSVCEVVVDVDEDAVVVECTGALVDVAVSGSVRKSAVDVNDDEIVEMDEGIASVDEEVVEVDEDVVEVDEVVITGEASVYRK